MRSTDAGQEGEDQRAHPSFQLVRHQPQRTEDRPFHPK